MQFVDDIGPIRVEWDSGSTLTRITSVDSLQLTNDSQRRASIDMRM